MSSPIPRLFSLVLTALLLLTGCGFSERSAASGTPKTDQLITEVWQIINRDYVDGTFNYQDWTTVRKEYLARSLITTEQTYQAVQEMVATLKDPYTSFLNPKDYSALQTQVSGELLGVGLQIVLTNDTQELTVVSPFEGSPAYRAGLRPRDVITAIDRVSTKGLDLDGAAAKLRGAPGSKVALTIRRNRQQFTVTLARDRIEINPVHSSVKEVGGMSLGYIRLPAFNSNATEEVRQAIKNLEHRKVKGYILDLRYNPGGLFIAGVEIARFWLEPGQTVVSTVNREGVRDAAPSASGGPLTRKPLVLLVNGGSASASEILAGALQDNKRAQLVGNRTFGKGLVQQVYALSDGSGLRVSIARYQTPSGKDIHKIGIEPDLKVDPPADFAPTALATPQDPQFIAAAHLLTRQMAERGAQPVKSG
ncbi:S41 family peptidase [Anthocerotibacter panamensis]|uniref:S41 family peptidase n=1 Tax=Anthocerotibacter panamensis TaxID=2857077 RepID=UPI001C405F26|nr:S41 family peptidase [Anthocerotibacter panamensis]